MPEASRFGRLGLLVLSVLVLVIDQLSKAHFEGALEMYQQIVVIPDYFSWTLAYNTGAAFSFLADSSGWQRWLFALIAVVVSAVLVVWLKRQDSGQIPIVGNTPVRTQIRFSSLGEPLLSAGAFSAGTVHVCATDQQLSLYQIVLAASGRISLRSNKTEQALCRGYAGTLGLRAANEPAAPWAWRK